MRRIEQLIQAETGLHTGAIGSNSVTRAVRARMKILGLKRPEDYQELLRGSPFERNELVESVVVTETWFFRDAPAFAAAAEIVRDELLPALSSRPARLLSLPCSSGEEPYSMAMALLDAGVPASGFRILAADISARSLAHAQRGIYGRNSFRGKELAFRDKYFRMVQKEYSLDPAIQACVKFHQFNLLGEDVSSLPGLFDIVFCRNLMIYFDPQTQKTALDRIATFLAPGGVLFVGPAEQPFVLDQGFVSAQIPMTFACRHPSHPPRIRERIPRQTARTDRHRGTRAPSARVARESHSNPLPKRIPAPEATGPAPPGTSGLERARKLADAGHLREAAELCECHLRDHGASAQAYYLIALTRDAAGDESAIDYYRKALYLEPNHYESLMHLALLLERCGEKNRARACRERAQRLNPMA